jgi:hypothetical protein
MFSQPGGLQGNSTNFAWAQYVFSNLEDRVGLRGFICASKVFLVLPDQITLAACGEAVFDRRLASRGSLRYL